MGITKPNKLNFFTTIRGMFTRIMIAVTKLIPFVSFALWFHIRDVFYAVANLFLPKLPIGRVIPVGHQGHNGIWGDYVAPVKGSDSRSPCPGLNTLANHNILPRNGKRLTYAQMSSAIQGSFNLAPSLADQLTSSAMLLDQGRGWINLYDLNALNVIQHDASFTRPDIAFCPDQSYPHGSLVDEFLSHSSNGKSMSVEDMSYYSLLRRNECKRSNGQFSLTYSFLHKFFGSGNAALMYSIFGGNVKDLRCFLADEKLPDGWEPRNREFFGHTILQAQVVSLAVEFNIDEKQKIRPADALFLEPNGI